MPHHMHQEPQPVAQNPESLAFQSVLDDQPPSAQRVPSSMTGKGAPPDGELSQIIETLTARPPEEIFDPEELAEFSPEEIQEMREHPAQSVILRQLKEVLAMAERPEELWLWCLHCDRFFQVKDLQEDHFDSREKCPLCGAAGFDVDIYLWNTHANGHPDWPQQMEDLRFGQRSPA